MKIAGNSEKLTLSYISKNRYLYIMGFVVLVWYIIFCYLPMYGIIMAFQEYSFSRGVLGSTFVGFKHFINLFSDTYFMNAFRNTWIINSLRLVFVFPVPIIFALMLNEVKNTKFKRTVQTVTYIPHFISWVILSGIMGTLLARDTGVINEVLAMTGAERIDFLLDNNYIRQTLIVSDIWKEMGWSSIIYLSTIASINPELYEAAFIDGAGRFGRLFHITIPSISNTIVVMMLLFVGRILMIGFEQIYNLYTPVVYESVDIVDTYIVRNLQENPVFGRLAAAGMVKSGIGFILLIIVNRLVKFFGKEGIY